MLSLEYIYNFPLALIHLTIHLKLEYKMSIYSYKQVNINFPYKLFKQLNYYLIKLHYLKNLMINKMQITIQLLMEY